MELLKNILKKIKEKKENKKTIFSIDIFLFVLLPILFLITLIQGVNYLFDNIAPANTYFFDKEISFKNKDEIRNIIETEQNSVAKASIIFRIEDEKNNEIAKTIDLKSVINNDTSDIIINKIFSKFSKTKIDPGLFLSNLFKKKYYNFNYSINESKLNDIKDGIRKNEKPTVDASIILNNTKDSFEIKKEDVGFSYNLKDIEQSILSYANSNRFSNVLTLDINKIINEPKITSDKLSNTLTQAITFLNNAPINMHYNDTKIILNKSDLINMLSFSYSVNEVDEFTEASIKLDELNVKTYLDKIANDNDKKPIGGELVVKDNKAEKFTPITKGLSLNKDDSYNKLQDAILTLKKDVYLTVDESMPTELDSDVVKYGLLDQLAVGESNFKGSSANRIKNITVGSSYVNGTLVKPGEEFSMIKTLKAVNAAMGYVPELVIKGDHTELEYGGGLCQVGTTMFRTAINGGFPIMERKNHSYRVPYYEPAGTDATIYFPKPDFRFSNNTKNYILVTTTVDPKNYTLRYYIWGTKDNRKVKITDPVITNIVMAPGTKWVETTELPVGKVKCTETSHNGADAEFSYNVEYDDGTKFEKVFKSHYIPWQAVCMKGVETITEPTGDSTDTGDATPTNIAPNLSDTQINSISVEDVK